MGASARAEAKKKRKKTEIWIMHFNIKKISIEKDQENKVTSTTWGSIERVFQLCTRSVSLWGPIQNPAVCCINTSRFSLLSFFLLRRIIRNESGFFAASGYGEWQRSRLIENDRSNCASSACNHLNGSTARSMELMKGLCVLTVSFMPDQFTSIDSPSTCGILLASPKMKWKLQEAVDSRDGVAIWHYRWGIGDIFSPCCYTLWSSWFFFHVAAGRTLRFPTEMDRPIRKMCDNRLRIDRLRVGRSDAALVGSVVTGRLTKTRLWFIFVCLFTLCLVFTSSVIFRFDSHFLFSVPAEVGNQLWNESSDVCLAATASLLLFIDVVEKEKKTPSKARGEKMKMCTKGRGKK